MELTFYDSNGRPAAYSEDREQIYTFSGEPVAYLDRNSVYSMGGTHLGWFENGWIRDHDGQCVFFTDEATGGGPMKPMKEMKPMKSMKSMRPMKGMKEMRPMRSMNSSSWSDRSGEQFFEE